MKRPRLSEYKDTDAWTCALLDYVDFMDIRAEQLRANRDRLAEALREVATILTNSHEEIWQRKGRACALIDYALAPTGDGGTIPL